MSEVPSATRSSKVSAIVFRQADLWLGALLILIVVLPTTRLSHITLPMPHPNLLDDSWQSDMVYKSTRHIWLGRDVIFTYGPLYQWLNTIPARLSGFSLGKALATRADAALVLTIFFTVLTGRLLLTAESSWKRCLFLILVAGFWAPIDLRVPAEILLFAVFLRMFEACAEGRGKLWYAPLAAILIGLAFLLSADTGFYSLVAFVVLASAALLLGWRTRSGRRRIAGFVVWTAGCFGVVAVAANAVLGGGLFGFRFLHDAFAMVSNYRWIEALPMAPLDKKVFTAVAFVAFVILLAAIRWRDAQSPACTRRPLFLFTPPVFALAVLQSAVVRSDWGHIISGLFPSIVFALAVLLGAGATSLRNRAVLMALAITLTGIAVGPVPWFVPQHVVAMLSSVLSGRDDHPSACNGALIEDVCFGANDGLPLQAAASYLAQHSAPDSWVLVFPYQNLVGVAAQRMVAGGILQNYLAAGDYLRRRQLDGYEEQRPPRGVYYTDGPQVYRIDDVTNFSRTPTIWFYMQSHYRAEAETSPGVLALVRDDDRAQRIHLSATKLCDDERQIAVTSNPETIDLGAVNWPATAEFLKLQMTLHYAPWWRLRRPARIAVEVELADGSTKRTQIVLPPNQASDVWIYPWEEQTLGAFLSPDSSLWRKPVGAPVTGIRLYIEKNDRIAMLPASISVHGAEAVALQADRPAGNRQ